MVGQKPTHIIGFGNNYIEKEIKFKLKVLLVSYFNSNNLGDVLLSNILYFELKKNYEIITCSFEGCFAKPKDRLYRDKFATRLKKKIIKKNQFWHDFEKIIQKVDILIIGGGNMLMDIKTYSTVDIFIKYVEIAHKYNKKIIVPFIGIGPISNVFLLYKIKEVFKLCNLVIVRDRQSKQLIDGVPLKISYDPAFILPTCSNKKTSEILINVINPDTFDSDKYISYREFYIKLIKRFFEYNSNNRIAIIVSENADKKMADDIKKYFTNKYHLKTYQPKTTKALIKIISKSKFVIGTRMHFMIIAYTQQIPFVGLKWQEKIDGFFDNIQLRQNCYEVDNRSIDEILEYYYSEKFLKMYDVFVQKRKKEIYDNVMSNLKCIDYEITET